MSREALLFRGAALVALLHALDDAFVHRGPGVGFGAHAVAGVVAVVAAVAAVLRFERLRPGLRASVAGTPVERAVAPSATSARSPPRFAATSISTSAPVESPMPPIRSSSTSGRRRRKSSAPATSLSQPQPIEFGLPSLSPRPRAS